jgi:hypothetical protein
MPTKQSVCMKRNDIVLWGLGDNACANRLFAPTGNPPPAHEHVSFVPGNGTRNDDAASRHCEEAYCIIPLLNNANADEAICLYETE